MTSTEREKFKKNGSSLALPRAEKKMTDRYDLSIPCEDVSMAKECLQRQCDAYKAYPFKVSSTKSGIAVAFIRNPNEMAQWKYQDIIMNIIKQLKIELRITTIMMRRKQGTINMMSFPASITQIAKLPNQEASEDDIKQLKKLEEDASEFMTNLLMQLDEGSDYDDKANIEALKKIARENRAAAKKAKLLAEEDRKKAEEAKKALEEKRKAEEEAEKSLEALETCSEEQKAIITETVLKARDEVAAAEEEAEKAETIAKESQNKADELEEQDRQFAKKFKIIEDKTKSKKVMPGQLMFDFA